jgi:hypothetical protein
MDFGEFLVSGNGLGYNSVFGLSYFSLDYAFKNKNTVSCYFDF